MFVSRIIHEILDVLWFNLLPRMFHVYTYDLDTVRDDVLEGLSYFYSRICRALILQPRLSTLVSRKVNLIRANHSSLFCYTFQVKVHALQHLLIISHKIYVDSIGDEFVFSSRKPIL